MGKAVEHLFEKEEGGKNEWRGMVLSRAPIMTHWYYITYEKDPVLYMYQLWNDYKDGDLRVLPEAGEGWDWLCGCRGGLRLVGWLGLLIGWVVGLLICWYIDGLIGLVIG